MFPVDLHVRTCCTLWNFLVSFRVQVLLVVVRLTLLLYWHRFLDVVSRCCTRDKGRCTNSTCNMNLNLSFYTIECKIETSIVHCIM